MWLVGWSLYCVGSKKASRPEMQKPAEPAQEENHVNLIAASELEDGKEQEEEQIQLQL
jgi:hypothetical protein